MLDGPWAAVVRRLTGIGAPGIFDWNCILFDRQIGKDSKTQYILVNVFRTVVEG